MPRVGQPGESVAELTIAHGWVLMTHGKEVEINKLMCMKTSIDDYENLCRLDALGVTDIICNDITVHQDFKNQLERSNDGWYESGLMWKDNFTSQQNNKLGSLGRLKDLLRNLQRNQK